MAMTRGALALLLATTFVGAAEAQTPPPNSRLSCRCTGAPFTLADGIARFHVALDDHSSEPSVFVLMKFINQAGTVVAAGTVTIFPGRSATLELPRGSGVYRVQAEVFESSTNVHFSERRTVVTSVDQQMRAVGQSSSGPTGLLGDDVIFQWIGPGPIVPCDKVNLATP
jgi:hypothetical protein